jgi:hypothetical protein
MKELCIHVMKDGNQWGALLGPDLQQGVAEFGESVPRALAHLACTFGKIWPDAELLDRFGTDLEVGRCADIAYEDRHRLDMAEIRRLGEEIGRLKESVKARNETLSALNESRLQAHSVNTEQAVKISALNQSLHTYRDQQAKIQQTLDGLHTQILTQMETIVRFQEEQKGWDQTVTVLTKTVQEQDKTIAVLRTERNRCEKNYQDEAHAYKSLSHSFDRAERSLRRAGFEDHGGEEWKPPVNSTMTRTEVVQALQAAHTKNFTYEQERAAAINAVGPVIFVEETLVDRIYRLKGRCDRLAVQNLRIRFTSPPPKTGPCAKEAAFPNSEQVKRSGNDRVVSSETNATVSCGESPSESQPRPWSFLPIQLAIQENLKTVEEAMQYLFVQIERYYVRPSSYNQRSVSVQADVLLAAVRALRLQFVTEQTATSGTYSPEVPTIDSLRRANGLPPEDRDPQPFKVVLADRPDRDGGDRE